MASPVFKFVSRRPILSSLVLKGAILLRFRQFTLPPNPTGNRPVPGSWFAKCLQQDPLDSSSLGSRLPECDVRHNHLVIGRSLGRPMKNR